MEPLGQRTGAQPRARTVIRRSRQVLSHGATHRMVVGSALAGLAAYGFQVAGARALGDVEYAPIGVLWTIQYLLLSVVLYTVEAYVTRLVVLDRQRPVGIRRAVLTLSAILMVLASVVAAVTYLFSDALFHGLHDLALVAGLTVGTYGAFVIVRGLFAGRDRFGAYGVATALESLARLALALPVLWLAPSTRSLAWIMPVGALVAALWWWIGNAVRPPSERPRWNETGSAPARPLSFVGVTGTANAAAQLILAGGPLVLVVLSASPAEVSVFFVATTVARAPLVLAYGGLLSRIMRRLVELAEEADDQAMCRVARRTAGASGLAAVVGGMIAWALGPAVIAAFFGATFRPPSWLASGAVAGVLLATGTLVLNQLLIAAGRERRMLTPWLWAAFAALLIVVSSPVEPLGTVTIAFVAAEVVALVGLMLTICPRGGMRMPATMRDERPGGEGQGTG